MSDMTRMVEFAHWDLLTLMNDYSHWNNVHDLAVALYSELRSVYCQDGDLMSAVNDLICTSEFRVHELGNSARGLDREVSE